MPVAVLQAWSETALRWQDVSLVSFTDAVAHGILAPLSASSPRSQCPAGLETLPAGTPIPEPPIEGVDGDTADAYCETVPQDAETCNRAGDGGCCRWNAEEQRCGHNPDIFGTDVCRGLFVSGGGGGGGGSPWMFCVVLLFGAVVYKEAVALRRDGRITCLPMAGGRKCTDGDDGRTIYDAASG